MLDKVKQAICEYKLIDDGDNILCAVSGGADSIAMVLALYELRSYYNFSISVFHLNHMLRGIESDRDEDFVRKFCQKYDIPFYYERQDVRKFCLDGNYSLEEGARIFRYSLLEKFRVISCSNKIATGHTINDSLETFFMNFARGTGLLGLCGVPAIRGMIIRPIILCCRDEVESYVTAKNNMYITDSSNLENEYTRNYFRNVIIKEFIKFTNYDTILNNLKILGSDSAFIEGISHQAYRDYIYYSNDEYYIKISDLISLEYTISSRLVRIVLSKISNKQISSINIRAVLDICCNKSPSILVNLPGETVAYRNYEYIFFCNTHKFNDKNKTYEHRLNFGDNLTIDGIGITVSLMYNKKNKKNEKFNKKIDTIFVNCDRIDLNTLVVRSRRIGDTIRLSGSKHHKSLKKLFIERKICKYIRNSIPVVSDKDGVICVYGFGVNEDRITDDKVSNIQICFNTEINE